MSLSAVTATAGLVSTTPSSLTRPSAIQRSASRREQSPARAITLAMRSPRGLPSPAASAVMASATAGLDEGREDAEIALADGEFRVPLHAKAEAAARILDALDDAVARRGVDDHPRRHRPNRLMM